MLAWMQTAWFVKIFLATVMKDCKHDSFLGNPNMFASSKLINLAPVKHWSIKTLHAICEWVFLRKVSILRLHFFRCVVSDNVHHFSNWFVITAFDGFFIFAVKADHGWALGDRLLPFSACHLALFLCCSLCGAWTRALTLFVLGLDAANCWVCIVAA